MKFELDLFGVIVPSLLLGSVIAYVLARIVSRVMRRTGLYRHVLHASLFDFALYNEPPALVRDLMPPAMNERARVLGAPSASRI